MMEKLKQLRTRLEGVPYERSQIELFKSFYDGPFGKNSEDLSSIFCSELVAESFQAMGLLDEQTTSNEYTPKDFSDAKRLNLMKGKLQATILVKNG